MENNNQKINEQIDLAIDIMRNKTLKDFNIEETNIVTNMLLELEYFEKIKDKLGVRGIQIITKCIKIKNYSKGSIVIKYGEEGKTFFIILKGSVDVFVPESKSLLKVKTLSRGSSFGEIAIIRKKPRTATVICNSECTLAVIKYEDYVSLLHEIDVEQINKFIRYLKSYEVFEKLQNTYLEKFYYICEKKTYKKNDLIFKEGDVVDGIYFILNGEFSILKSVVHNNNKLNKVESQIKSLRKEGDVLLHSLNGHYRLGSSHIKFLENKINFQSRSNRIHDIKSPSYYELVILKDQEIFGDIELFKNLEMNRTYSVICKVDGKVYFFPKEKFFKNLTQSLIENFNKLIEMKTIFYNKRYKNTNKFYFSHPDTSRSLAIKYFSSIKNKKICLPSLTNSNISSSKFSCSIEDLKSSNKFAVTPMEKKCCSIPNMQTDFTADMPTNRKYINKSYLFKDQLNKSLYYTAKLNTTTYVDEKVLTKKKNNLSQIKNQVNELNISLKKFHQEYNKPILDKSKSQRLNIKSSIELLKKNVKKVNLIVNGFKKSTVKATNIIINKSLSIEKITYKLSNSNCNFTKPF